MTTKQIILTDKNYQLNPALQTWKPTNISSPIIDFRVRGFTEIRRYNARLPGPNQVVPFDDQTALALAKQFIETLCIPFCVFDGADTTKIVRYFNTEVDWFQCRQEWEIKINAI